MLGLRSKLKASRKAFSALQDQEDDLIVCQQEVGGSGQLRMAASGNHFLSHCGCALHPYCLAHVCLSCTAVTAHKHRP